MRIPDVDPGDQNHADADPQHCFKLNLFSVENIGNHCVGKRQNSEF
jgi:hypothetical protein